MWHMTHDIWHVTCDILHMEEGEQSLNFSSILLIRFGWEGAFKMIEQKDDLPT